MNDLVSSDEFVKNFWCILNDIDDSYWVKATKEALNELDGLPSERFDPADAIVSILTETQFGQNHFKFSKVKKFYYQFVRPILPVGYRSILLKEKLDKKLIRG